MCVTWQAWRAGGRATWQLPAQGWKAGHADRMRQCPGQGSKWSHPRGMQPNRSAFHASHWPKVTAASPLKQWPPRKSALLQPWHKRIHFVPGPVIWESPVWLVILTTLAESSVTSPLTTGRGVGPCTVKLKPFHHPFSFSSTHKSFPKAIQHWCSSESRLCKEKEGLCPRAMHCWERFPNWRSTGGHASAWTCPLEEGGKGKAKSSEEEKTRCPDQGHTDAPGSTASRKPAAANRPGQGAESSHCPVTAWLGVSVL